MQKWFKINSVAIVCAAFIFKFLFINISFLAAFNSSEDRESSAFHFHSTDKNAQFEISHQSDNSDTSEAEICEEDTDDEKEEKADHNLFHHILLSFVLNKSENNLSKIASSSHQSSDVASDKYILFRSFRI